MMLGRWARQRPLTAYFTLAFGMTWCGILALLARHGLDPSTAPPTERNLVVVLMLLDPCTRGTAMTTFLDGPSGVPELQPGRQYFIWFLMYWLVAMAASRLLMTGSTHTRPCVARHSHACEHGA